MSWREHTNWFRDENGDLVCATCRGEVFGGLCDCYESETKDAVQETAE